MSPNTIRLYGSFPACIVQERLVDIQRFIGMLDVSESLHQWVVSNKHDVCTPVSSYPRLTRTTKSRGEMSWPGKFGCRYLFLQELHAAKLNFAQKKIIKNSILNNGVPWAVRPNSHSCHSGVPNLCVEDQHNPDLCCKRTCNIKVE